MLAIRLCQNTAEDHFNQHAEKNERFGRRVVLVGHIMSLARALSSNGLANAFSIVNIEVAVDVAPTFAGDTIYAWSEVLGKTDIASREDLGALRLRTVASKDQSCAVFP
jgi:2-methylfumaryl-CoA hydratase